MSEKLMMKIDGKDVEFTKGQTILQVAIKAGIYIPTLCYIDGLTPWGGCRLCTVKVVGSPKPFQTACSSPATAGMNIITIDNELQQMRRDIVQLVLSEHPNGCLVCGHNKVCDDYNSKPESKPDKRTFGCFSCSSKAICELSKIVEYLGITKLDFDMEYKNIPVEDHDIFFQRDYNLCILCGKCVRACSELRGINAIDFMGRGHAARVSTPDHILHIDSNCQFCGSCVDICPTGVYTANTKKWHKDHTKPLNSICGFCSVSCGFAYHTENDVLIEAIPDDAGEVNHGQGCVLGRFCTPEFIHDEGRLTTPMINRGGKLTAVEWEDALIEVKNQLAKYKPEEIACLLSPDLSNESAFVFKQFADKVLHTPNIATISDENLMAHVQILNAIPRSFEGISTAKNIVLINANPQISHPLLLINLKKAKDKGAKLVSWNLMDLHIPKETSRIFDEEVTISHKEILERIKGITQEGTVLIIGQLASEEIYASAINTVLTKKVSSLIPLRTRANIEGVFQIVPNVETEILKAIADGKIKALYTTECIPSDLLKKLECIIVQDIYDSDISAKAQVVLPTCTFIESSGSITNAELKQRQFKASISPMGAAKPDWRIISELAKLMNPEVAKDFEYMSAQDITSKIEILKPVNLADQSILPISKKADIVGKVFTLDSFKYRGEKVSKHVSDYKRMMDTRVGADQNKHEGQITVNVEIPTALPGTILPTNTETIEIFIDENGAVKVGDTSYGLDAINAMIRAANGAGYGINMILDAPNKDFIYINKDQLCLCHNYKDNLSESEVIVDLGKGNCKTFIRSKNTDGKVEIKPVEGVVLMRRDFVQCNESDLKKFCTDDSKQGSMQANAIKRGYNLAQTQDILLDVPQKVAVGAESGSEPVWDTFGYYDLLEKGAIESPAKSEPSQKVPQKVVEVNVIKCIGCGTCEEVCPHEAVKLKLITESKGLFVDHRTQKAEIDAQKCFKCMKCVVNCPVGAISVKEWCNN